MAADAKATPPNLEMVARIKETVRLFLERTRDEIQKEIAARYSAFSEEEWARFRIRQMEKEAYQRGDDLPPLCPCGHSPVHEALFGERMLNCSFTCPYFVKWSTDQGLRERDAELYERMLRVTQGVYAGLLVAK